MTSGRKNGDSNKKTLMGTASLQLIFQEKTKWYMGLTKDELISKYFNIPYKKVLNMRLEDKNIKWHEIVYIRRYLRNKLHYAIDFKSIDKGVTLVNKELGERLLKNRTNVYFKISNLNDAEEIDKRYKKMATAFSISGDNVILSAEESEKEKPIIEKIKQSIRNKTKNEEQD